MIVVKFGSILLCLGLSVSQSIPGGDSRFFMTEEVRLKRQAGYVYNRPSVSFDLPPRPLLPSLPSTQAPIVDRVPTRVQQMYYAYPVPARSAVVSSDTPLNPGATVGQQPGGTTGYNYPPQIGSGLTAAPAGVEQGAASAGQQTLSSGAGGYKYNVEGQPNSGSGTGPAGGSVQAEAEKQGSGAAGYSHNAPTAGSGSATGAQASTLGVAQTQAQASAGSRAGTISDSGYSYKVPDPTLQPNFQTEVSTNAPKYLPPTGSVGGTISAKDDNAVQASPSPPPLATGGSGGYRVDGTGQTAIPAPPTDQYLPPLPQTPTENTVHNSNVNAAVNTGTQTSSVSSGPSASYIPPATGSRPSPAADVTPRPFAPPPPSSAKYLPPNVNNYASPGQSVLSTPAATYLPPVL